MGLEEYNKKREFDTTPEPKGTFSSENTNRFVIQRHKASHLHYDLRLEMEGVLKSWAIPKGPSMNPKDKRLAIQTEDHPVKYLSFQGTIPKGNYGAGVMTIWDSGTFSVVTDEEQGDPVQQWKNGDLKLRFFGTKIKGVFALVHTSGGDKNNQWLLIKKNDNFAVDLKYDAEIFTDKQGISNTSVPVKKLDLKQFVSPMLATSAKAVFNDPDWVYELKWDGYRVIAHLENGSVTLYSRNGIAYSEKFSPLVQELESVPHDVILDGEVVVVNLEGVPQFQALQKYDPKVTEGTLRYYVFDLLYLNGHDTIGLSLLERKSFLPELLEDLKEVRYCEHIEGMGTTFYQRAVEMGMEGVIAKKADSTYSPGFRSDDWLKIKSVESEEAIICGYTESKKGGSPFGSLILGRYHDGLLTYIGNCGSGFSSREQRELLQKMMPLIIDKNPFGKKIDLKGRVPTWMRPELICEVKFSEWTKQNRMRHPVFKGLRGDKIPSEIMSEKETNRDEPAMALPVKNTSGGLTVDGVPVSLTHLDKVYWPASGYTKYDLIDYYIKVGDVILPYLKDRPENLHRHPDGIDAKGFFQKDNETLPEWVETFPVFSKASEKESNYLLCQNQATLLQMANLGCIEINPWHSRIHSLDQPDYTVIDIDPSEGNTFTQVTEVALAAKEILDSAKIKGYCKTSGSSGVHIYIPLGAKYSYDEARNFTKLLCYYIHEKLPQLTSMERSVKKRNGKIYLDFLQNRRGQTIAAPYCVRPRNGAPVSAPLSWKEVESGVEILDFTIKTMPGRIEHFGDWFSPVLGEGIDMQHVLEILGK